MESALINNEKFHYTILSFYALWSGNDVTERPNVITSLIKHLSTRIMKSKGQRPYSSTHAVRVFGHFLPEIEYW